MNSGNAVIIAATILGLSILGGAYLMVGSLDRASGEVAALGSALAKGQAAAPWL